MKIKRLVLVAALAGTFALGTAGTAAAIHTHVRVVGNGQCVVIAEDAGEERVALPLAVFAHNPHAEEQGPGRQHPLHVLVHQGRPGEVGRIFVFGSPQGNAACANGYVNRP